MDEIAQLYAELERVANAGRRDEILFRLVDLGAGYWVDLIDGSYLYWPIRDGIVPSHSSATVPDSTPA